MASVLPFTSLGCQRKPSQQEIEETQETLTQIVDLTNETLLANIENKKNLEKEKAAQKEKCRISAKNYQIIDNFTPKYNYEELYPTNEELLAVLEEHSGDLECAYENEELDVFDLVFKITDNTYEYLKTNSKYKNIFSEDIEYMDTSMTSILYRIFSELKEKATHDLKEDFCRLSSLKIVIGKTDELGLFGRYVLEENLIVLYLDNIKLSFEDNINEYIIETLKHELDHVYQIKCPCQEKEKYYSLSTVWDGNEFIPSYIEEASAESYVYNVLNDNLEMFSEDDYTYLSERNSENLMLTLGLTSNPESSIEDYYATIFDTDLVEYCNFLGATTLDEKQRLLKIDYTINAIYGRNHLLDNVENVDFRYQSQKEVG